MMMRPAQSVVQLPQVSNAAMAAPAGYYPPQYPGGGPNPEPPRQQAQPPHQQGQPPRLRTLAPRPAADAPRQQAPPEGGRRRQSADGGRGGTRGTNRAVAEISSDSDVEIIE